MTLSDLERLAREATPGPWKVIDAAVADRENYIWSIAAYREEIDRHATVLCSVKTDESGDSHCVTIARRDAEFIAACDPDTVLALLRVVRAAAAVNESRCAPPCPAYLGDPHDGACPERADLVELTDALAALNLKDET